jgi:hypothetical protein
MPNADDNNADVVVEKMFKFLALNVPRICSTFCFSWNFAKLQKNMIFSEENSKLFSFKNLKITHFHLHLRIFRLYCARTRV